MARNKPKITRPQRGKQQQPQRPQRSRYSNAEAESTARVVNLTPKNDNQGRMIKAMRSSSQVIVTGYAGTGKTYLAATEAANLYLQRKIKRIVVLRPAVAVGKDPGALPGDLAEKNAPWAAPVIDVLIEQLGNGVVESGLKNGNILAQPIATARGKTLANAFIIIDEAQNLTIEELKLLTTRVGEGSRLVINGDIKQTDLRGKTHSGLSKCVEMATKYNMGIPIIDFGIDDIVRSDICKQWIIAFDAEGL